MVSVSRPLEELRRRRRVLSGQQPELPTEPVRAAPVQRVVPQEPIIPRRVTPKEPIIETGAERRFATDVQFRLLREILEQGLGTRQLTSPIFLTPFQASELGVELEEGEFLRIEPGPNGEPLLRLITPEGITDTIPFEEEEEETQEFLDELIAEGQTPENIEELKEMGATDADIAMLFPPEELALREIPPEGFTFTVEDESGLPLELFIQEDFEFVGTERTKVSDDLIVFHQGREVGRVNYETGEFTPRDIGFWESLGQGAIATLEKVFIPASFVGAGIGYLGEELSRRAAMTQEEWEAYRALGLPVASLEDFRKFLPGGEYFERLQNSPFWVRMGLELPFWYGLAQGGVSAVRAIKALEKAAEEGTIPKAMAIAGRAILEATTLPTQERIVGFVVSKTVQGTYTLAMSASLRRNLRSWAATQGKQIPKETEDAFVEAALKELSPRFLTKQAIKTLFKPTKGGFTVTEAGAREAERAAGDAVRRAVPRLLPGLETAKPIVPIKVPPTVLEPRVPGEGVVSEAPPLTQALITDAERIVTQAETLQPDNPQVQEMRRLVDEAKTLTGREQAGVLDRIDFLEDELRASGLIPKAAPTEVPEKGSPFLSPSGVFSSPNVSHKEAVQKAIGSDDIFKYMGQTGDVRMIIGKRELNVSMVKSPTKAQLNGIQEASVGKGIVYDIADSKGNILRSGTVDNFDEFIEQIGIQPQPTPPAVEGVPQVITPVIRDSEVKLAYDKALQSLPEDIRSELDNVVKIGTADLEGRGGNVVELKGRLVDIVVDKSEADLVGTVRHELLHAYLLKHPEKITGKGFFGLENTIREIEQTISQPTPPAVEGELAKQRDDLLAKERRGEDVSDEILKVDERIAELRGEPSVVGRVELPSGVVEQATEKDITIDELTESSMFETIPPEAIVETTPDTVDDMPVVHDINVIDRFRPARFVFDKMGQFDIWESAFKAETLRAEEQVAFNKELKKHAKKVKDKGRRELVWEHVNNSKSDVFKQLTFEEKQAANWWKRTADDWANRLNIPQEQRIKDYIPHIFDEAALQNKDLPIDSSLGMVFSKKITDKVKMPFLEKRLGKELGLVKDPFLAAQAYQNVALRKFYYEPILQKLKLVAEHSTTPEFARNYLKDYSRRMTGEPAQIDKEINKTLADMAGAIRGIPGGGVNAERLARFLEQGNASARAAYNLTSGLYFLWLGFKPTTAIRNLSQHGLIIAEVDNIQDFANGIRLRFTKEGRTALGESLVVRSRRGAFVESIDSSVIEGLPAQFRETSLFLFRKADEQNVKDAFLSGYAEAKRLFPDAGRDVWIKRGDEVASDTQYLYTKMNSMGISQNGPGKVGAMLTTWAVNWLELMNKFVRGRGSKVYANANLDVKEKNWLASRKSLLVYMTIVGLAMGLEEQDWNRVRALEYTGFTTIRTFANLLGGEFPALDLPGSVADLIIGTALGDERLTKTAWNNLKNAFSIFNQVEAVASGERDWLSLFFYLEGKTHQVRKLKEDWEKNWKPYDHLADPLIREKEFPGLNRNTAQKRWREQNPKIEAQMFITNRFSTLSSEEAREEVLRLIEKHNIDTDVIGGYEKIFGVDTTAELTKFENRIGQLGELEAGKEAKYFTVGNFLTEANEAVRINGRDKVERDGHPFTVFLLGEQDSWQPYEDYDNADARALYRQLNPDVEASLYLAGKIQAFENPESAKVLLRIMDKFNIPPQAVLAFNQDPDKYDELFTPKFELELKNVDLSNQFDELETDEERGKFREDNPEWVADMRRIEAIDKNVPEGLQDDYVNYYTLPVVGFDQERFLRDNEDYYNEVWLGILGNQEIGFDKIPTVEFEETLIEYERLDLGADRYNFRGDNLDFDAEGVRLGKWKPFQERKVKQKAEVEPRPKTKEPELPKVEEAPTTRSGQLEELERRRRELQR